MKRIVIISILTIGLITITNAQGITNTLGGNTADDKFVVENKNSEAGLVVTGEGKVGIGTSNPLSKLSVGGYGNIKHMIFGQTGVAGGSGVVGLGLDYGVLGEATGISGIGLYGITHGNSGKGVYGHALHTLGANYGGYFSTNSNEGRGVYGKAENTSGTNYGGKFSANGNTGRGVYGKAENTSGANYGGYFVANGLTGNGVVGEATNTGFAVNIGGKFEAAGTHGWGVYAIATGNTDTGGPIGGLFRANGKYGKGVAGEGLSSDGYAGYFNGRGYFSENVGIGEKEPSDKLHVNSESGQNAFRVQIDGSTKLRVFSNGGTAIGSNHQDTPANGLYVLGDIKNAGGVLHTSDERFKTDIKQIDNSLTKLKSIRGIYYNWNIEKFPKRDFTASKQIGVLAQEVEKEFPELVNTDNDGYKSVNYSKITPILIEAIKALEKRVEELENR